MHDSILKYLPSSLQSKPEVMAFLALAGCVSLVQVSIAASQILLAVAIAGFVWMLRQPGGHILRRTPAIVPLLAYMLWTMIAIFASPNPTLALTATRKFYLLLLVVLVPVIMRGEGRLLWACRAIFAVAAISSLWGIAQFAENPVRDLMHRIQGSMSQWMTYSGLLMLVLVLLTAYASFMGLRKHKWIIPVAALIVFALILTLTRNAWIGAIAGIVVLIMMRRPRAIFILLAAVLLFYALSPGLIRQRLKSSFDMTDPRIHVYMTAIHLIQDNPWFGVGPKNVKFQALKYRDVREFPNWMKESLELFSSEAKYQEQEKEYPDWLYQHMHNNLLQMAAEIGIPGVILWLWFMIRLAWDALSCYRYAGGRAYSSGESLRREALLASSAALAAWVALMLAGLFEYNFGDSEVLTFFLFIVSSPYAFLPQDEEVSHSEIQRG